MIKLPSAKVYSYPVSVSYPGQSLKCVKVTTLGPRTLVRRDIYLASSSELNNLLNMELLSTMQILSKRVYI